MVQQKKESNKRVIQGTVENGRRITEENSKTEKQ